MREKEEVWLSVGPRPLALTLDEEVMGMGWAMVMATAVDLEVAATGLMSRQPDDDIWHRSVE